MVAPMELLDEFYFVNTYFWLLDHLKMECHQFSSLKTFILTEATESLSGMKSNRQSLEGLALVCQKGLLLLYRDKFTGLLCILSQNILSTIV